MKTKKLIILLIILILVLLAGIFLFKKYQYSQDREQFLSKLKGQVVFTRRNSEGVSDIWKINANGTNEEMVFHNDDSVNANSIQPYWSENKKNIYFKSMENGKWKIFEMNINNSEIKINKKLTASIDISSKWSKNLTRDDGIIHKNGDLFIQKNNQEIKIYNHKGPYNQDYMQGALEASWSPDKKYIIFQAQGYVMIADLNSNYFKLTAGESPDWK